MNAASRSLAPGSLLERQRELVQTHFEPQLAERGLSIEHITSMDVQELRAALEELNELIGHPERFPAARLEISADEVPVAAHVEGDFQLEVRILPLLLDRKKVVLSRLRELGVHERVSALRDLVTQVADLGVQEKLSRQVYALESESAMLRREISQVQAAEAAAAREVAASLEREHRERERVERRNVGWLAAVTKEPLTTVLGAAILVFLLLVLVIAMFTGTAVPELVSNAFLVILGYFFGQVTSRQRIPEDR